ncbi:MAG: SRPBCC domain-containing protein, partial [Anaerolineales bacterium]|nr:SRPBCC domain-containing protein [Anaerolineales bacterium]
MSSDNLSFRQVINTDPENAYRAFTNATELRGWLCNVATVVPRPGGRIYLWWESGYYTSGEFTTAESNKEVSFTWFGKGEPAQTQVEVSFTPQDGGTLVEVNHRGLGSGQEWEKSRSEIGKGWKNALENLNSVITSGEDLRFVSRPMLGIILDEFNQEIAEKLGLSSSEGIRIGGTVNGMGAEAAGIQENDVITSMGGMPTINFETLNQALNARKAGDTVEVVYYRDGGQKKLQMTLSGRPIPEIPDSAEGLAEAVNKIYKQIESGLYDFLSGVSEEEAAFKPDPSEWSIKDNIAHFIQGERFFQEYMAELVSGFERFADDYGGNVNELLEATAAVYPTVTAMADEYKLNMAETLHFIAHLPDEFLARKGEYWRLAHGLLQDPYHF